MPQRTLLLPPPESLRVIPSQNPPIPTLQAKHTLIYLMLWQQEHLPRSTTKQIFFRWFTECHVVGRVCAENHHVGEISPFFGDLFG